jgi:hypothetical protein
VMWDAAQLPPYRLCCSLPGEKTTSPSVSSKRVGMITECHPDRLCQRRCAMFSPTTWPIS